MNYRKQNALEKRNLASQLANERPHSRHISNGDEQKFRHTKETAECHDGEIKGKPSYLMSYTKGLPHHGDTGLIENPDHFQFFVRAIDSGDFRDFRDTPLGTTANTGNVVACEPPKDGWKSKKAQDANAKVRAWESQSAGLSFELEGPDAQAVTMPPAPKLGSDELTAEMAEVYVQALLRDIPFNAMSAGVFPCKSKTIDRNLLKRLCTGITNVNKVKKFTDKLNGLKWFTDEKLKLNEQECARRRGKITPSNAFRGITTGDEVGPYLSQFLLAGNTGINSNDKVRSTADGLISYGGATVNQRVRTAKVGDDHLTQWDEWLDVQNGADLRGLEGYEDSPEQRFIFTPRDLATYVHYDALYQAYLNACLILLGSGTPFDPGIPFQEADNRDHQQGFAHFGGPHILSLVTEVATRALKAVRFQKFNVHRRCRPEVLAARLHKTGDLGKMAPDLNKMHHQLNDIGLLSEVRSHNAQFGEATELLPMAFCEGSPMHPAYGAGHATVAGACVTILKAFFDHGHHLSIVPVKGEQLSSNFAYVSIQNGSKLGVVPVLDQQGNPAHLTVEGELNKLASNISIGRDWAGVHYFTDYYESLLMGEQIAIGILEEQKLMYTENFSMTVPLFGGGTIRI